jgi:hypothetical protein
MSMMWILAAILSTAGMAVAIAVSAWYFGRIRDVRADPYVNPSWPSTMRPPRTALPEPPYRDDDTSHYHNPDQPSPGRDADGSSPPPTRP